MDYIAHHGIKGQRWGDRRWQNDDGSLTPAGRLHYGIGKARESISGAVKKAKTSGVADTAYSTRAKARRAMDKASERALSVAGRAGERVGNARDRAMFFIDGRQAEAMRSRMYAEAEALVRRKAAEKQRASYESLVRQQEYRARVDAAKRFLSVTGTLKATVAEASNQRFYNRGFVWGEAAKRDPYNPTGPLLTNYRSARSLDRTPVSPSETVRDLTEEYRRNIMGYHGGTSGLRDTADRLWRKARGR